jgi:DNA-binding beta-propeller fold protein YncE
MKSLRYLTVATTAFLLTGAAPFAADPPQLVLRATYSTGLVGDNAEVISIRHHDAIAAISNTVGSVHVLDLSDPLDPTLLVDVPIDTTTGPPNSVAVHPQHDYFLVVTGRAGVVGTIFAHRLSDGALLASAPLGIQPDSVVISPNGQYAVVANEAEGTGIGGNGGAGSLSIVDLSGFNGMVARDLVVRHVPLPSFAGLAGASIGRTDDIARLAIDNLPATLEPENIAFSPDSRYAFITLQENNIVIRLDVKTGDLWAKGVGQTTHPADLTNNDTYQPTEVLTAFREPDGIAVDQTGRFFVTADEGDTRNAAGASGPRGGRTLSVFDARTLALIADTGKQLDDGANAIGSYPDGRSNRGGSEPEGLDLTHHRGLTLVAVALERANAVALVDVTDPTKPEVITTASLFPEIGPETVKFFRRGSRLFVASGNEVTGSVSILEVVF